LLVSYLHPSFIATDTKVQSLNQKTASKKSASAGSVVTVKPQYAGLSSAERIRVAVRDIAPALRRMANLREQYFSTDMTLKGAPADEFKLLQSSIAAIRSALPNKVHTKLVAKYSLVSSPNTALTQVQALSPISVSDWSGYAGLYDLCRVHAVTVHVMATFSLAVNGTVTGGLAFDPSNLGAYASVADVMTAAHRIAPMAFSGPSLTVAPLPYNGDGFWKMHAKLVPARLTADSSAAALVGGGWFATADTTALVGWLKPYVDAGGASNTSALICFVTYDCEFASRT